MQSGIGGEESSSRRRRRPESPPKSLRMQSGFGGEESSGRRHLESSTTADQESTSTLSRRRHPESSPKLKSSRRQPESSTTADQELSTSIAAASQGLAKGFPTVKKESKISTSTEYEANRRKRLQEYWKTEMGFKFIYQGISSGEKVQPLRRPHQEMLVKMLLPDEKEKAGRGGLQLPVADDKGRSYTFIISVVGRDTVYIRGDWHLFFQKNSKQGRNSIELFALRIDSKLHLGIFLFRGVGNVLK